MSFINGTLRPAINSLLPSLFFLDDTVIVANRKLVQELEVNINIWNNKPRQYCLKHYLVFNASKTKRLTIERHKDEVIIPPDFEGSNKKTPWHHN